jgi:hypothetical protein
MNFPCIEPTKCWLESLHDSTRLTYVKRITNFVEFCLIHPDWTPQRCFHNYIMDFHASGTVASSLWTIFSILGKYYKKQYNIDLEDASKSVSDLIKQWSKNEVVKKSEVCNILLLHFTILLIKL